MEVLKMQETFVHILKNNAITHTTTRSVPGICSLFFFGLTEPAHTHPECWEIHTEGDELLLITKGEVMVEMVTTPYAGEDTIAADVKKEQVILREKELVIIPKGHWHRIVLKKVTDLVVITFGGNSKLAPVENIN